MKVACHAMLVYLLLGPAPTAGHAQASAPPISASASDQRSAQLEERIAAISAALTATQQQIEQSQRQMQQLQQQLLELRQQMASAGIVSPVPSSVSSSIQPEPSPLAPDPAAATAEERQQTLEAAVKLHDQTKVESNSKYPVRLTGLILFNGFLNKGVPDNTDLPAVAQRGSSTSGNGNLGAGLRQTILGIEGDGPRIAGASTSANVNIDFFANIAYTPYGTSAGVVRMRTASVNFDWANDSVQVGIVPPLISPLSPASFATVAEPLARRCRQPVGVGAATPLYPPVPAPRRKPRTVRIWIMGFSLGRLQREPTVSHCEPRRTRRTAVLRNSPFLRSGG